MNQTLAQFSDILIAISIVQYFLTFLALVFGTVMGRADRRDQRAGSKSPQRFMATGQVLLVLAFAFQAAGVISRGISVNRVPWGNMYEFAVSGSCMLVAVYLITRWRVSQFSNMAVYVVGPVLLLLLVAQKFWYIPAGDLLPALQNSLWLVIHVAGAVVATALFGLAAVVTVLQLLRHHREQKQSKLGVLATLPESEELEHWAFRLNAVGFVLWGFTLMAGAIWARYSWGRFWGWDPKEVWTFVIWVVYAAYLHARATKGFRGTKAAWFSLVGFVCVILNFTAVNMFANSLHSYSGLK